MPGDPPLLAVVDDDADVRIALVRLISSAGFAVESFATGAEFLLSIERRVPDCLILDLQMPGMSGFDVQAALARNPRVRVPVVVITGHDYARGAQPGARARRARLPAQARRPRSPARGRRRRDGRADALTMGRRDGHLQHRGRRRCVRAPTRTAARVMALIAIGEMSVAVAILVAPREVALLLVGRRPRRSCAARRTHAGRRRCSRSASRGGRRAAMRSACRAMRPASSSTTSASARSSAGLRLVRPNLRSPGSCAWSHLAAGVAWLVLAAARSRVMRHVT